MGDFFDKAFFDAEFMVDMEFYMYSFLLQYLRFFYI